MIRIGLTGGVGSGKSTVAKILAELGALVLDADKLGHQVYAKGTSGWAQVVKEFGQGVLTADGEIDRKKLGAIVFADRARLKRLEDIVQPEIGRKAVEIFDEKEKEGVQVGVLEAAVLFEAGFDRLVHRVWVTYAPEEVVIKRLTSRDGLPLPPEEARRRIAAQMPIDEKAQRAQVIIRTDCTLEETRAQVVAAWNSLRDGRR
ncbi:MAG: dephospho-CoA kinase [Chloroflexi bacterium]|nr:dephospho-CoA kinase [Chloroflexota bacterium]